jgi:tetratricopeptide (TPR) repeat protein
MNDLRATIIGLLGFAAAEERMLLAASAEGEPGNAGSWAAVPLVAHNTEFKHQQVQRLDAILADHAPPEFGDIDHTSADVYQGYAALTREQVARDSSRVSARLIDDLTAVTDDDLRDPARNPWLRGRQLWLQIVVRGFWHPTGHIGGYYLEHARPDRAVALAEHGVATAAYLGAADPARGMAFYNLASAQARAGRADDATAALREAIALNPDVRANAARDADLAILRDSGRLEAMLA